MARRETRAALGINTYYCAAPKIMQCSTCFCQSPKCCLSLPWSQGGDQRGDVKGHTKFFNPPVSRVSVARKLPGRAAARGYLSVRSGSGWCPFLHFSGFPGASQDGSSLGRWESSGGTRASLQKAFASFSQLC